MDLLRGDSGMHNLVIMKTFSKIYGLAGQRVGYIVGRSTPYMPFETLKFCSFSLSLLSLFSRPAIVDLM